jgi:hypothetical protein
MSWRFEELFVGHECTSVFVRTIIWMILILRAVDSYA